MGLTSIVFLAAEVFESCFISDCVVLFFVSESGELPSPRTPGVCTFDGTCLLKLGIASLEDRICKVLQSQEKERENYPYL